MYILNSWSMMINSSAVRAMIIAEIQLLNVILTTDLRCK